MLNTDPERTLDPPARDGLIGDATIVSISDIHGYLDAARSALLTLSDHPDYDPVVERDGDGLRWASNDYVLVFNGDLIDRGPDNGAVLSLVADLIATAGPERVRVTLGNHEMGLLTPALFGWGRWYSGSRSSEQRRRFCARIQAGHVVAAYRGHRVTYAHAGRPDPYDPRTLNDDLAAVARDLAEAVDTPADAAAQREAVEACPEVLGLGGRTGRGPGAGIAWLDFEYMPLDAPPQVVGHTRQARPRQDGAVVCENVIRSNSGRDGGEAVILETPDTLCSLERTADGGVRRRTFDR